MKLGVADWLPHALPAATSDSPTPTAKPIDAAACRAVRDAGFRGSSLYIREPLSMDARDTENLRRAFYDADLEIAQLNGRYQTLCNPDDTLRAEGIAGLQALVRIGAALHAPSVYARPGTLNPANQWWAHPDNYTQVMFDRIADSLKRVAKVAEVEGIDVAIEGHVTSTLDTPQRVKDLMEAVSSNRLKFNLDPVNFIGDIRSAYEPAGRLHELVELLGQYIVVAHAKDCTVADGHVVHINETTPGAGRLNYAQFMSSFHRLAPNGYFIIEHIPPSEAIKARAYVVPLAKQLGIPLET